MHGVWLELCTKWRARLSFSYRREEKIPNDNNIIMHTVWITRWKKRSSHKFPPSKHQRAEAVVKELLLCTIIEDDSEFFRDRGRVRDRWWCSCCCESKKQEATWKSDRCHSDYLMVLTATIWCDNFERFLHEQHKLLALRAVAILVKVK